MSLSTDAVQARHHRCSDGLEVVCLTLHGFTLPEPLYAPLDLLQQQVQELQALNNGLQTIISLQSQVEKSLWERHLQQVAVLENASAAYICLDEQTAVVSWNHAAASMLGWHSEEVLGKPLARFLYQHPQNFSLLHLHNSLTIQPGRIVHSQEWTLQNRFGHELTVEVCTYPHSVDGQYYLSIFLHDITRRKLTEQALEQETRRDLLTGLLNRKGLYEALQQQGGSIAVLFIDIDGFKAINDNLGHDAGDMLLRQIAERLRQCVRSSDGVARLAGDEFVLLLPGIMASQQAGDIAAKLLRKLSQPYHLAGHHARVGASIGIHLVSDAARQSAEAIIASADQAMYEAKRRGKGCYFLMQDEA
ncbi:sensor domain-containing diguanylate cyclase [Vogesella sp. DC21W]|uniref:Sensor domain-containing diguanylate cyclase n=1 Tax=Vogesella aquatica TaxID=2984206 RepID=A0ABT5IY94_9NEIS|nr:sensor domain-containing diguanylate cyclase [Vogesella aquatica]MDC7717555.1 sensor domain-containing diguanylate cyclase [Vogesella aquatica]